MSVIRIDLGEVEEKGRQFTNMQSEVEELVSRARSMMNSLEGQFMGARAQKIFSQWNEMLPSLDRAIRSLGDAGTLLNKAAQDFRTVDSQ